MAARGRGRGAPECAKLVQTYAKLDSPATAIKAARRCPEIMTCGLEASSAPTSGGRPGRRPSYLRASRTMIPVIKQLENRWPSTAAELEHVKREILEVRRALMEWQPVDGNHVVHCARTGLSRRSGSKRYGARCRSAVSVRRGTWRQHATNASDGLESGNRPCFWGSLGL